MSATCDASAERLTTYLGFSCRHANPVITLRNPFDLASWTMPFLELLIIAGAVFAFVHARHRMREGDPTNLALWFASLVYLFVTEPPLYFPDWFGLNKQFGFIFAHNTFTVQLMYDRLPLYIVAIYPALSQLAYELVRSLGLVQRRSAFVSAVCTALVCQLFYETFDQLGPQLRWWAWNVEDKVNHPMLDSVPLNSIVLFASVSFGVMTYLVLKLVGEPVSRGRRVRTRSLVIRIVLVGALAPLGMGLASLPSAVFGGNHPHTSAEAVVLTVEIVALWIAGGTLLIRQWRDGQDRPRLDAFVRIYPAAYLIVMAVFWGSALADFLSAHGGVTRRGTPIGNLPYTLLCFIGAAACIGAVVVPRRPTAAGPPSDVRVAASRP